MSVAPEASDGGVLDALARGLRQRVLEQRRAEERLAGFAFREEPPISGQTDAPVEAPVDWRYYLLRTLRESSDADTLAVLERLAGGDRPLRDLGADPLAVADRIGRLATAGLVSRALDGDRVALAPLGEAVLDLVHALEALLAAGTDGEATAS